MDKPLFNADAAEEYFTSLCTYYRDTRNDILKRDNEGRHASEQVYSAEYQKFLGMELAMREVLEYFSKFDLGSVDEEPLTLEELREMDGQPVFIRPPDSDFGDWALIDLEYELCRTSKNCPAVFETYGKTWLAYRRPPAREG